MVLHLLHVLYQNFKGSYPPWHWHTAQHLFHLDLVVLPCPAEYPLTYPKHRPKIPLGYLIFPSPKATPTNRDPCLPIRPLTYSHPIYLWDNLLYCLGPNHYSEGVYSFNCLKSGMTYYTLIVGQNFLNNLRGCVII